MDDIFLEALERRLMMSSEESCHASCLAIVSLRKFVRFYPSQRISGFMEMMEYFETKISRYWIEEPNNLS